MKKTIVLTTLCVLFATCIQAQQPMHFWKKGPLTWNDFAPNGAIGKKCSHLEYGLGLQGDVEKRDGIQYYHPGFSAFVNKDYSWADPAYRTPRQLAYNQCAFDILEIHRRNLENYYFSGKASLLEILAPEALLDSAMFRAVNEIALLGETTDEGRDSTALLLWQTRVRRQLDSIPFHTFDSHSDAPWRWGATFELGYSFLGGNLHNYLGSGIGIGITGEVGYQKHFFSISSSMGYSGCKKELINQFQGNDNLYQGDGVMHTDFYIAYGHAVIDNARSRLVPFVGFGWQKYYHAFMNQSSLSFGDRCIHAGVDYHFNYSNTVQVNELLLKYHYNSIHYVKSIHTKLFFTYNRFQSIVDTPAGFTLNLQLGIGLLAGRAHCE